MQEITVKPIFVIKVPFFESKEQHNDFFESLKPLKESYHVLMIEQDIEHIQCEVLNSVDIDELKYDELIQAVKDLMENK